MERMSSPVWLRSCKIENELSGLSVEDQGDRETAFSHRGSSQGHQPTDPHQTTSAAADPTQTPVVEQDAQGTDLVLGSPRTAHCPNSAVSSQDHQGHITRPTPCTPTGHPVTPQRSCPSGPPLEVVFQPLQLRRQQLFSLGSLESPSSRPRGPWGGCDPYDSTEDQEYVGFATLPNQVHRKTVKKGFTFTVIVAGESGLGKSTLINSLFLTDLYKDRKVPNAEERISQTIGVVKHSLGIEEKGVKLRLTIVDTPGFGDAVNNTQSWRHVEDYIDQQFEQYFRDESGLNRKNIQDNRVHCCLYFISPFGHGMRPLDVECMRALHNKVNLVPVLAKADSMTPAEVLRKKHRIKEEIDQFGINIYQFPECESDEDEEFRQQEQLLKDSVPFTVIGSNIQVDSKGRRFRGRLYPWGVVEVENPAHSDFLLLRNMLIRTHMQDLKDVTRETHYENYRAQCIHNMTRMVIQERKRSLRERIQSESGVDFGLPLAAVDSETERLIMEKDDELRKIQEVFEKMQERLQKEPNVDS